MINPKNHLLNLTSYHLPADSRKDKIRLDLNENLMCCSPKVMAALKNINPEEIAMYPESGMLMERLARQYNLLPENVIVTNGGDDAIRCILDTYVDNQERAIIATPGYPMFKILLQQRNAQVIEVLYNQDFSFPAKNFLSAIGRGVRIAIIVNPNNPTGSSVQKDDLMRILEKAQESEVIVVLDETYYHYASKTYIELVKEFDNFIVMQTFSKAFGLTGLRMGYIMSNKFIIVQLDKINLPFPVNTIAITAAVAALEDTNFIETVVNEVQKEKEFLCEELRKLTIAVTMTDINFLLAHFGEQCNLVHQLLAQRGILVKNLNAIPLMQGCLRISIGTRKEHLLLLKALEEIIFDLQKGTTALPKIQSLNTNGVENKIIMPNQD